MLKTKKRFNLFLTVILAFSMLFGSFQSIAFAEEETVIENVFNQKWHDASQPVSITARSNQDLTKAVLRVTVGGKDLTAVRCKASAVRSGGFYVISGTLPSDAVLGANELKLFVDGQAVASADIYLTSYVNTAGGDTLIEINFEDATELEKIKKQGYFNDTEGVLSSGEYVFENKPPKDFSKYGDHSLCFWTNLANKYAAAPDAEDLYFDASFQQSGDELGVSVYTKPDGNTNRIKFYGPDGTDWGYHLKIMGSNGAYGEMIKAQFPVSKTTFRLRIDKNKETYEVYANNGNGEEKLFGGNCSFKYNEKQDNGEYKVVESKRFDLYALRVSAPGKVVLDNVKVVKIDKFPEVGAVYYNNGSVATKLEGASVPMFADSFTIGLDKAVSNVSPSTVTLQKIGGSVISGTTASFDSTNKTITLNLGDNKLEAGAKYSIVLSKDIIYNSEAYDANTEITFTVAQPDFALITPADGASIKLGDNLTISGTAPVGTTITASLDTATKNTTSENGTWSMTLNTTGLSLGKQTLSVTDGSKTIGADISIVNSIDTTYYTWSDFPGGTFEKKWNAVAGTNYECSPKKVVGTIAFGTTTDFCTVQTTVKSTDTNLSGGYGGAGGIWIINSAYNGICAPYKDRVLTWAFKAQLHNSNFGLQVFYNGCSYSVARPLAVAPGADPNHWYDIKVVEDRTGGGYTGKGYLYVDGQLIHTVNVGQKKGYEDFQITAKGRASTWSAMGYNTDDAVVELFRIDDMTISSSEPIPSITAATYNAGSDIAIDKLVPANATNIKLTLDSQGIKADTATADNIKLYVNGTDAQAAVSYDANTKVITIDTTGKLSKYDDAKIVIGSTVKTGVSGNTIGNDIEYSFKVADDNMHYFKLNKNGTETEFVVINGNETALVCTAFLASYEDAQFSELSQVISDSINLAKGASYIKKMVASKADNKAMIWSADLTPYVKSK